MIEENTACIQKLQDLLGHYEDGWNFMINAPDRNHWNYPLKKKPGFENDKSLPDRWMALAVRVMEIMAVDGYTLDIYENEIRRVPVKKMQYIQVHGLPMDYDHWIYESRRIMMERQREENAKKGHKEKLFEVVFPSNPAVSFFVETNTKVEDIFVGAHAPVGHNAFSKGNFLFQRHINADSMIRIGARLKGLQRECEEKYGRDRVRKVFDLCHALEEYGFDLSEKPKRIDPVEEREAREKLLAYYRTKKRDDDGSTLAEDFKKALNNQDSSGINEQNILRYIADNAPHLEEWERDLINGFCDRSNYFLAIMKCQVINEGWASFWHFRIMKDLYKLKLIDTNMYSEALKLHVVVVEQKPGMSTINPYALGFEILSDIVRICVDPDEEDYKWRPEIAGSGDWLKVLKRVMKTHDSASLIEQYLSPKVIRHFRFFNMRDESGKPYTKVSAIHNPDGFTEIRQKLAAQYRLGEGHSTDHIHNNFDRVDLRVAGDDPITRKLTINHNVFSGKPVDENKMREVLDLIQQAWRHPVTLHSIGDDGKIVRTIDPSLKIGATKASGKRHNYP